MAFTPQHTTLKDSRVVTLRAAAPADADAMQAFMNRLRASTPFVVTAPDEAPPIEKFTEDIESTSKRPGALILIAVPRGDPTLVVGDCWLVPYKERKMDHVANIGMGCDVQYQGCGLGTALLGTILKHAQQQPELKRLELGVMPENTPAVRLYKNLGFVQEGTRPNRFKKDGGGYSDELIMGRYVASQSART